MSSQAAVNINLRQLSDIAHTGVRRAVLFMGLGLNAMHREEFRDYQLHKLPHQRGQTSMPIDFFPSDLPNERVDEFKKEFSLWITGCGLREMLEHYAVFLDHIHKYGLLVQQVRGLLGGRDPEKEQRNFHRNGNLAEKLRLLNERFEITPSEPGTITQLYVARNCLTHDLGIVGPKHCDGQGHFAIFWTAFDMVAIGDETGTEVLLADLIGWATPTSEPTSILMRRVKRHRTFKSADKLRFSQQDLWELCFFFNAVAIPTVLASFVAYLKANGIPISEEQRVPRQG